MGMDKAQAKQKYKDVFAIVKKNIDDVDFIGLLEMGAKEIVDKIISVFLEMFEEKVDKKKAEAVAEKIFKEVKEMK